MLYCQSYTPYFQKCCIGGKVDWLVGSVELLNLILVNKIPFDISYFPYSSKIVHIYIVTYNNFHSGVPC